MELEPYYALVEEALRALTLEPEECRGPDPGSWAFHEDEFDVWIDVWTPEETPSTGPYFQIFSDLFPVDAEIAPSFFKEVLQLNNELQGISFALREGNLILRYMRPAQGLTAEEVVYHLNLMSHYHLEYVDILNEKYIGNQDASGPISDL